MRVLEEGGPSLGELWVNTANYANTYMPPYTQPPQYNNTAPYNTGIHIGEVGGRPYLAHPNPLDMDNIKVEVDSGGPYMHDGLSPTAGGGGPGRTRKNKEDKICGVCGDRALGYNFDAISCESCKAFFRRNAPKGLEYFKCPYDEKCKMDISNRRFCKRCRLRKCFEIGMRKEYILTEEEKARKRQKIEENRPKKHASDPADYNMMRADVPAQHPHMKYMEKMKGRQPSTVTDRPRLRETNSNEDSSSSLQTPSEYSPPTDSMGESNMAWNPIINESFDSPPNLSLCDEYVPPMIPLSDEDSALVDELKCCYCSSLEITMEKEVPREDTHNMSDLVNIAEISVRRVIDMAKKVKSFKALPQRDQISLLKGGSIELLILRSVLTFDKDKQHFLDPLDEEEKSAMNLEQLKKGFEGNLFEDHMKFVHSLAIDLCADQTMLILLLVISLFSPDRPGLTNKEAVSSEQETYSMLLKKYLESKYPMHKARALYPKLLMKLTDIRNLNEEHSQVLLKVNPEGIQPLMQEVLDLK